MTEGQRKTLGLAIASMILGIFFLIPLLGFLFSLAALILGIVALVKINKNKAQLAGEGMAIAGIVMGGLGILVLPIMMLLAAIAIPNILRARLSANEAMAQATLRTLGTALESYRVANDAYPLDESALTQGDTPYLDRQYDRETVGGYTFSVQLTPDAYEIVATPETCGVSGTSVFRVGTDGVFSETPCGNTVSSGEGRL